MHSSTKWLVLLNPSSIDCNHYINSNEYQLNHCAIFFHIDLLLKTLKYIHNTSKHTLIQRRDCGEVWHTHALFQRSYFFSRLVGSVSRLGYFLIKSLENYRGNEIHEGKLWKTYLLYKDQISKALVDNF